MFGGLSVIVLKKDKWAEYNQFDNIVYKSPQAAHDAIRKYAPQECWNNFDIVDYISYEDDDLAYFVW